MTGRGGLPVLAGGEDMYQCPITYFTDNIIISSDRSAWAVFKLTGYDYDFLADEAKIRILYRTARFLSGIMSEAQILMLPTEQDDSAHFKDLERRMDRDDPLCENAVRHARQTLKYLEQMDGEGGRASDYRTYVIVRLAENSEYELASSMRQGIQYFLKDPINALNVFMNLDTRDILESRLEQSRKAAEKWFFSQNQKLNLNRAGTEEVQWLIRRGAFRGIPGRVSLFYGDQGKGTWSPRAEYVDTERGDRILKPLGKDILNLFTGAVFQENRSLKIIHDRDRISYQTFLVITSIPEPLEHPGNEWLYLLQQLNEQAEVCIHIKAVEYRAALRSVTKKRMEMDSQMEHIAKAHADIPDDLAEGKEYADMLETELKSQRSPLLDTSITICLAADSTEALEKKAATIRGMYEDMSFGIERPQSDQLKLFMQCIPGVGSLLKDYCMPLTPLTLASGVFGATHELGDSMGGYIGTTGAEGKHVFLDLGRACLLNKSASATFYGNLGVGKSFNANLLLFLTVLYGGYGLIFDPKGERSHWAEQLTVMDGLVNIVTLSADSANKGKMDPYNMYIDNPDEADELALNVISELLRIAPASMEYTAVLEAQRKMRSAPVPSMMQLASTLDSFPAEDELHECARFLARRLRLQAGSGMSRLLFGDGSERAISLDNRLNILQIENLKMPSQNASKDSYTNEENLSAVLMAVAAHYAKKWALVKRPVFKVILFDESWMLGKTAEGIKLFDFLSRMGRSLYTGCIFNGHSVLDIPSEGISNTITYKFCFQTNNDSEAVRMCEYMNLEPTQENREVLRNLGNGECLFQDLDRHVGILKFDAVFRDIIDVFSTTPKTRDDMQETQSDVSGEMDGDTGQLEEDVYSKTALTNIQQESAVAGECLETASADTQPEESVAARQPETVLRTADRKTRAGIKTKKVTAGRRLDEGADKLSELQADVHAAVEGNVSLTASSETLPESDRTEREYSESKSGNTGHAIQDDKELDIYNFDFSLDELLAKEL